MVNNNAYIITYFHQSHRVHENCAEFCQTRFLFARPHSTGVPHLTCQTLT